jgi:rod shape-determining protein MreC
LAIDRRGQDEYGKPVRRVLIGVLVVLLLSIFGIWRIDNPRVERFRSAIVDKVVPSFDWAFVPVTKVARMFEDFQSYTRIYEQNQELRRELQQFKAWREAALQLEQENARLLDLNKVRLNAQLTYVTGVVLTDNGSPFRRSVLLNVGARDGIVDGWATMDGLGLVGRISGVGDKTSRVILLSDSNSRVPVTIQPSGQKALLVGDNTLAPPVDIVENIEDVRAGDRVVTSGDGKVFPADILVGQIAQGPDGRLRVRLAADYGRLEFLRVLRNPTVSQISTTGELIATDEVVPVAVTEAGE